MSIAVTPVHGVEPVKKVWPHIKPFIQTAVNASRGAKSLESIAELILNGAGHLYVAWDTDKAKALGFIITEYDDRKTCRISLIGGVNRKTWTHLLDPIYNDARSKGCVEVVATLPRGWARDLEEFSITAYAIRLGL